MKCAECGCRVGFIMYIDADKNPLCALCATDADKHRCLICGEVDYWGNNRHCQQCNHDIEVNNGRTTI